MKHSVERSVAVNNNRPIQDYVHPDDQTQPTFEMTPGFKPFTVLYRFVWQKNPIVSVNYENDRISIKNSLPYLKCVLRLSCVVQGLIYGRFMGFYILNVTQQCRCSYFELGLPVVKTKEIGIEQKRTGSSL